MSDQQQQQQQVESEQSFALERLPEGIKQLVCARLDVSSLASLCCVSRAWRTRCSRDSLWRQHAAHCTSVLLCELPCSDWRQRLLTAKRCPSLEDALAVARQQSEQHEKQARIAELGTRIIAQRLDAVADQQRELQALLLQADEDIRLAQQTAQNEEKTPKEQKNDEHDAEHDGEDNNEDVDDDSDPLARLEARKMQVEARISHLEAERAKVLLKQQEIEADLEKSKDYKGDAVQIFLPAGTVQSLSSKAKFPYRRSVTIEALGSGASILIPVGAYVQVATQSDVLFRNLTIGRADPEDSSDDPANRVTISVARSSLAFENCVCNGPATGCAIAVFFGASLRVSGCKFSVGKAGIYLGKDSQSLLVEDCEFMNSHEAVQGNSSDLVATVRNCSFFNMQQHSVSFFQAKSVTLSNCTSTGNIAQTMVVVRVKEASITGCKLEKSPKAIAVMVQQTDVCTIKDTAISGSLCGISCEAKAVSRNAQ